MDASRLAAVEQNFAKARDLAAGGFSSISTAALQSANASATSSSVGERVGAPGGRGGGRSCVEE